MAVRRLVICLAVALVVTLAPGAGRAEEQKQTGQEMPACCQQKMAQHAAGASALDEKLATMNAAQGAEKVDAMAAVINELVARHRAMHAGGAAGATDCPMMGGAAGSGCPAGCAMAGGECPAACPSGCPMEKGGKCPADCPMMGGKGAMHGHRHGAGAGSAANP